MNGSDSETQYHVDGDGNLVATGGDAENQSIDDDGHLVSNS